MSLRFPNGSLFSQLLEREFHSRYAGSALGFGWALAGPLLLLSIYSFVFGQLFKQRFPDLGTDNYTLFVATALWPWMMFSDGIMRGMMAIQSNANLVKKIAFPHILLVTAAVSATFALHLVGWLAVLAVLHFAGAPIHVRGVPFVILGLIPLYLMTLGIAAFLATLQTLLRDVEMAVTPAITMLHFLTPVLYPLQMIPEAYRDWMNLNPVAGLIMNIRANLLFGVPADQAVAAFTGFAIAAIAVVVGFAFFFRLSPHFEDFL